MSEVVAVPLWLSASRLSDTAFRLYTILATGIEPPSIRWLAREMGWTLKKAEAALIELQSVGLINYIEEDDESCLEVCAIGDGLSLSLSLSIPSINQQLTNPSATSDEVALATTLHDAAREIAVSVMAKRIPKPLKFVPVMMLARRFLDAGFARGDVERAMIETPTLTGNSVEFVLNRKRSSPRRTQQPSEWSGQRSGRAEV